MVRKDLNFLVDSELSNEKCSVIVTENAAIVAIYMELQTKVDGKRIEKDITPELEHLRRIVEKFKNMKLFVLTDSNAKYTA